MSSPATIQARIEALASRANRYAPEAYHFVFQALDFVLEREEKRLRAVGQAVRHDRHVSATQLLDGLRAYAIDQYGPLARLVLERWGVDSTDDFGEIVFDLVEGRLLNKQESDRREDFRDGFSFHEAFDRAWDAAGAPSDGA